MSTETAATASVPVADPAAVLADITVMLRVLLDEHGFGAELTGEITAATTFHGDLELESIDLVALSAMLRDRYGDRVNFAEFIADLELDEIITLTIGQLVDHVVASLAAG